MISNTGNYPPGTGDWDISAPWNQQDNQEPIEVECCVSYCLSKTMPITVSDYQLSEEYDADVDDDGHGYCNRWVEKNFENTDLVTEFNNDSKAIGIPTLLKELQNLAENHIEELKEELDLLRPSLKTLTQTKIKREIKHYEAILEASKGWTEDSLDICPE